MIARSYTWTKRTTKGSGGRPVIVLGKCVPLASFTRFVSSKVLEGPWFRHNSLVWFGSPHLPCQSNILSSSRRAKESVLPPKVSQRSQDFITVTEIYNHSPKMASLPNAHCEQRERTLLAAQPAKNRIFLSAEINKEGTNGEESFSEIGDFRTMTTRG